MVDSITSLTSNGLRDWLIQRISALFIAAYTLFLLCYFYLNSPMGYENWKGLYANPMMRIASLLTLTALVLHAWVGVWTITTDYIKSTWLRISVQMLVIVCLFASLLWGLDILWRP
jgi:succinate dehydrogenase / fumarate reductase membrane anchor subunit